VTDLDLEVLRRDLVEKLLRLRVGGVDDRHPRPRAGGRFIGSGFGSAPPILGAVDRSPSPARAWNTWDTRFPASFVHQPSGFAVRLSAYSAAADRYSEFPFGSDQPGPGGIELLHRVELVRTIQDRLTRPRQLLEQMTEHERRRGVEARDRLVEDEQRRIVEQGQHRLLTVAVHDLVIHPRDQELVIATHGRSIYVMDIAPLEDLRPEVLAAPVHLFDVKPATLFRSHGSHGLTGGKVYAAPNPPFGASIQFYLRDKPKEPVRVTIADAQGKQVVELKGPAESGLKVVTWDLRPTPAKGATEAEGLVAPGDYVARLEAGGRVLTKRFHVEGE